jgi:predicted RNase H-like HicB family nuclease
VIEPEGDGYVVTCPEVDVVSQGDTVEEARLNLLEAVEGFLEVASPSEIRRRPDDAELRIGTLVGIVRQSGWSRALFETD